MIKIGFIGVGSMGKNHLRVALELNKYYEVVGFYDKSPSRSKKIENMFGVKRYNKIEKLLDDVDACVIATPASSHKDIGIMAAKKGKNILMEKPICLNIEEAKEFEKYSKNLVVLVSHVERYNPTVIEVANLIKKEPVKDIVGIEIHRCSPFDKRINDADVIEDLMIHDVDILINALWPYKIKEITAFGNHKFSKNNFDYVQALIQYENGTLCSIVSSRSTEDKIRTINIHTRNGYITADMLNRKLTITRRTTYAPLENNQYKQDNVIETLAIPILEPLKEEYISFYNCIKNKTMPITNIESSIATLKLCKEIQNICKKNE
jgi:predicted dehydrogenase